MELSGKTALVTGAASGIGRATCLAAAAEGADVICLDIADPAATVAEITGEGGRAEAVSGDVRDPATWTRATETAAREFGGVYLLANVAGAFMLEGDRAITLTTEGWDRMLGINLEGVWLGMRAVLPGMVERGQGRIVNVASLAGIVGLPSLAAYSAAKAGVVGLTRQVAIDHGRDGIRVNAVAPGVVATPMNDDNDPEMTAKALALTPCGRAGKPEEVAATILFLASVGADFITGQVIAVDGGRSACGREL